jgi:NAD(P)-binding Rossmann-like domain
MTPRNLVWTGCCLLLAAICLATEAAGDAELASEILTSDVCIIGGGSGGTYSAIRLKQHGKTVTVVEKEAVLGGHVNTYTDPATGVTLDYGVISFDNISVVTNYFKYFDVPLGPIGGLYGGAGDFVDFTTGKAVSASVLPSSNATSAALLAYNEQLSKYPFLVNGYNLPSPVPEDFLITWGDFLKKYELNALAYTAFTFIEGVGNILAQPTLYILKYFAQSTVQNILTDGFLTTVRHDNHELYDKALIELGSSALVSSNVTQIIRNPSGVEVTVSSPSGTKLIKASKLLIAIQPKLESLSFLDLSSSEKSLLGQFNNSYYWDALLRNPGFPANTSISNLDPSAPFALPAMPGIYGIDSTYIPGIWTVYYSSPYALSEEYVKSDILASTARIVKAAGYPPVKGTPEFVGFNDHRPFELTVSVEAIRGGFYDQLNKLQGEKRTWWTGATWQAHDSSLIWNWTEYNILPELLAN